MKGKTWSFYFPKFDVVKSVAIDYMHCILLGVVKMLMSLWFDGAYKKMPWYIGHKVKEIDQKIQTIKFPNVISRLPRSMSDIGNWKATEFWCFLLFYSGPVLWEILPQEYFIHYMLLTEAVFILLNDTISKEDLKRASVLIKTFCIQMRSLYGARYQTYNVHNLIHIVLTVFDLGNLWANSAFWYEDYNGDLRNLFHGTQRIDIQIVTSVCIQQKIPELLSSFEPGSTALELYHRMSDTYHHHVKSELLEYISECSSVVGKIESFALQSSRGEKSIIEKNFGRIGKCYKFKRLLHKNIVYHSKEYTKPTRCNSYTVLYKSATGLLEYGFIKFYIKCFNECKMLTHCSELCSCRIPFYVAMIDKPQPVDFTGFCLPHVLPFHNKRSELDCCKVDDIQEMCVSLALSLDSNTDFICRFPNRYEKD